MIYSYVLDDDGLVMRGGPHGSLFNWTDLEARRADMDELNAATDCYVQATQEVWPAEQTMACGDPDTRGDAALWAAVASAFDDTDDDALSAAAAAAFED